MSDELKKAVEESTEVQQQESPENVPEVEAKENDLDPIAQKNTRKYSDEDVDKIIARKIAAERKRMQKLFAEDQQISELEEREKKVRLRELKADAKDELTARGLPVELSELLDYTDTDKLTESIDKLQEVFDAAVQKKISDALRGKTPRASHGSSSDTSLRNAFGL